MTPLVSPQKLFPQAHPSPGPGQETRQTSEIRTTAANQGFLSDIFEITIARKLRDLLLTYWSRRKSSSCLQQPPFWQSRSYEQVFPDCVPAQEHVVPPEQLTG